MAQTFTISEYIAARLIRLGIELSEVEIQAVALQHMPGVDLSDTISVQNIPAADKACLIPLRDILLLPDMAEGGYSIKLDRNGIVKWYDSEVNRLGLGNDPVFSITPKVRDASNRW